MGLSVFNHVSCPVTVTTLPALVVLHSSVSIQFSASTCRTHAYVCRHISTPSKFGVNLLLLCLCGAVERENFFWSRFKIWTC